MTNPSDVSDVEEDALLNSILRKQSDAYANDSDVSDSDNDEDGINNSNVQDDIESDKSSTESLDAQTTEELLEKMETSENTLFEESNDSDPSGSVINRSSIQVGDIESATEPSDAQATEDLLETSEITPFADDSNDSDVSESNNEENELLNPILSEEEIDDSADESSSDTSIEPKEEHITEQKDEPNIEKQEVTHEAETKTGSKNRKRKLKNPLDEDWVRTELEEKLMQTIFGNKDKLIDKLGEEKHSENLIPPSKVRQAVWHDSDDEGLHADDVIDYDKKGAPTVRKQGKYKVYLEQTFQNVLGTPAWANLDRQLDEDEDSDDEQLLRTVGHLAKPTESARILPTTIQFKRMKDLNRASYAEGPAITGLEFHPTSSVALVTGKSGIATIYSIDGRKNEKLHGLQFDNFQIKSCRITRSGNEAIVGGSKKFFYSYNLMTGDTQRTFLPKTVTKMSNFELSPDGRLISVSGRFGEIHLLNASSKELVSTLKQEHQCTSMTFTTDSNYLLAHSTDAEVTIFDIRANRAMHRFNDEGCVNGSCINLSPNGRLLATGSEQGVVNVYDFEQVSRSSNPKPEKTVFNLTTGITSTEFNHSSEILAIGSKHINDAIKLVHITTGTVYANFPGPQGGIGKPNIVRFSPMSGYLAIGNMGKEVTLYRLKHFSNY